MGTFAYKAVDSEGQHRSGLIEAGSVDEANSLLAAQGDFPFRIHEHRVIQWKAILAKLSSRLVPVKPGELILFTKQISTMVRVGVPMLELMRILEKQTENRRLKRVAAEIAEDIKEGSSLSDALSKHPTVFSPLYCNVVHAGETSGTLPETLDRLIYIIEHEAQVKADIHSAIQYPIVVMVAMCLAFAILLTFVVPKFVKFFSQAKIELPFLTRLCLALSHFMTQYWYVILFGLAVIVFVLHRVLKTREGRFIRDRLLLRIPLIGPLLIKAAMSRFASIFAILQASGVLVLDSMRILSGTIGNEAMSREFDRIYSLLQEGGGVSGPLKSSRYFPPLVVNMVAVGEESGKLDLMLREVAAHYDSEVRYAMKKLTDSIGPVLIVALAVVVAFFALAIYLPMWDLTKMAKPM